MTKLEIWDAFREEMMGLHYADEFCDAYWSDEIWEIIDKYQKLFHRDKTPQEKHLCKDCKHFKKRPTSAWGECTNPLPTRKKKHKARYGSDYGCIDFTEVTHGT